MYVLCDKSHIHAKAERIIYNCEHIYIYIYIYLYYYYIYKELNFMFFAGLVEMQIKKMGFLAYD